MSEDVSFDIDRHGIAEEIHHHDGFDVHVSYYTKSVAGPDTQPMYSCWVEAHDGRKSKQLNDIDKDSSHPLLDSAVWDRITDFVAETPATGV